MKKTDASRKDLLNKKSDEIKERQREIRSTLKGREERIDRVQREIRSNNIIIRAIAAETTPTTTQLQQKLIMLIKN